MVIPSKLTSEEELDSICKARILQISPRTPADLQKHGMRSLPTASIEFTEEAPSSTQAFVLPPSHEEAIDQVSQ